MASKDFSAVGAYPAFHLLNHFAVTPDASHGFITPLQNIPKIQDIKNVAIEKEKTVLFVFAPLLVGVAKKNDLPWKKTKISLAINLK